MDAFFSGLATVFSPGGLAAVIGGSAAGIFIGAMPGLGPSLGVALLIPLTFSLPPAISLIMLVALYLAAEYGGSISAVLIGTPGTAAATATVVDGYPLSRKGYPGKALSASLIASTIGGALGGLALMVAATPIASFALRFGPVEYCALGVLGLSIIASLSGDNLFKGLTSAGLGLLATLVGLDAVTGVERYTFGQFELFEGIPFLTALIGLFAVTEVFMLVEGEEAAMGEAVAITNESLSFKELVYILPSCLRGALMGTVVGAAPGAGGAIACWLAYDQEKRFTRNPNPPFGEGQLRGIAGPEASNSATVGGALIPLLTLGIPGSPTTAVLIGALIIHGLQPGPRLFVENQDIISSLYIGLIAAYFAVYALGRLGLRLWISLVRVPAGILAPAIFMISVLGAYSVRNMIFDVWVCMGFGLLGYLLKKYKFPLPPMILAMILGPMIENNYYRAMVMSHGGGHAIFFESVLSSVLVFLAFASFAYSGWRSVRRFQENRAKSRPAG